MIAFDRIRHEDSKPKSKGGKLPKEIVEGLRLREERKRGGPP